MHRKICREKYNNGNKVKNFRCYFKIAKELQYGSETRALRRVRSEQKLPKFDFDQRHTKTITNKKQCRKDRTI